MKPLKENIQSDSMQSFRVNHAHLHFLDSPWHYHYDYELFYIIKSNGKRIVGDSIESFKEGDMVFMGPNLPHIWKNGEDYYHNDPFEIANLANNPAYAEILNQYKNILEQWVESTDDKGQYPENKEGLKFMLGIWGDHVENPEYKPLIDENKDFGGSLFYMKSEKWKKFSNSEK